MKLGWFRVVLYIYIYIYKSILLCWGKSSYSLRRSSDSRSSRRAPLAPSATSWKISYGRSDITALKLSLSCLIFSPWLIFEIWIFFQVVAENGSGISIHNLPTEYKVFSQSLSRPYRSSYLKKKIYSAYRKLSLFCTFLRLFYFHGSLLLPRNKKSKFLFFISQFWHFSRNSVFLILQFWHFSHNFSKFLYRNLSL